MGILKHLLFWPVTGPTFLARFSMEKVQDTVKEQLTDDQVVKEELLALQMQLELEEIDDDEYVAREAQLMQRLREVRQWREEFGMGTSGGPVRVSGQGPPVTPADGSAPAEDEAGAAPAAPGGDEDAPGEVDDADARRGGIAASDGASVELNFDWD